MPPRPKTLFAEMLWFLRLDLSDYRLLDKARLTELTEPYWNAKPWQDIAAPNQRTQAILAHMQEQLRKAAAAGLNEEMKLVRASLEAERGRMSKLQGALEDEILQGVSLSEYQRCWFAHQRGDEKEKQLAAARIERQRVAWRASREQENEKDKKAWQAGARARRERSAEALRDRKTGFAATVNWFEPMPVYNHPLINEAAPPGYAQATGQDRITVKNFLRVKNQKPVGKGKHIGAGKPLHLYGFQTNLMVLDKWLGDWLLHSPHALAAVAPPPERVCEEIARCLSCAMRNESAHVDPDSKQFCALLHKHWQRWWRKVTDEEVRARLQEVGENLSLGRKDWQRVRDQRRQKRDEIAAKLQAGYFFKNGEWVRPERHGPMPFAEVEAGIERLRRLGR